MIRGDKKGKGNSNMQQLLFHFPFADMVIVSHYLQEIKLYCNNYTTKDVTL